MRSAMGNAETLIVFRVGGADAALIAPEFHPMEPNTLAVQVPTKAWLRRALLRGAPSNPLRVAFA